MPSRTSYFNKTLFWSDLKRYWPLTAGCALLWLLIMPLTRLTSFRYGFGMPGADEINYETVNLAAHGGYWMAFFFGIFFAMAAFSYLTNPRATNGLHALGAKRETLYLTHYLAGLCAQLAAQALAVLLTAAVLLSFGVCDAQTVWQSLLALVLPTLFFYSFGVVCMVFTGQMLAAPVFYGVLNVLAVGVELLVRTLAGSFLYGWSGSYSPCLTPLSPIVKLVDDGVFVSRETVMNPDGSGIVMQRVAFDWLLIYAAAGLVFTVLGLLVYRRRHSEETGTTVAIGWARPIFKYGFAFCAALALGQLLYQIFFAQYRPAGSASLFPMLLCMAVSGLLGFFASEMLLKKSFRVWRSARGGALIVMSVLVLLGVAMSLDLTGYERYVPDAGQVERVSIHFANWNGGAGVYGNISDPEAVDLVTGVHRAIVNDKARQQRTRFSYDGRYGYRDESESSGWLSLTYVLKDGSTVSREYNDVVFYASELSDPASVAASLRALYNSEPVVVMRTLEWDYQYTYGDIRTAPELRFTGGVCQEDAFYREDTPYAPAEQELTSEQAQAIFEAALRDIAADRAAGSLFSDESVLLGSVQLFATFRAATGDLPELERTSSVVSVRVTEKMTDTLAALRAAGIDPQFS